MPPGVLFVYTSGSAVNQGQGHSLLSVSLPLFSCANTRSQRLVIQL